ncbi:hypothetical protein BC940DRAFT_287622 [Gongronella butleri]|nr:hypothetical protein BC940DRAFT_287622 [Gongronella butleri]
MTNPSPHPNSYSPKDRAVFQWPVPLSPRAQQETPATSNIPWREMMDRHKDDTDTLRQILNAKAEEDKRQAASDMLKAEEARIRLKRMELEYLHEQFRLGSLPRYYSSNGPPQPASAHPAYMQSLTPVQQQMVARITGHYPDHYDRPASPSQPQTAHPLCPPTEPRKGHQLHRLQIPTAMQQPTTPVSPAVNGHQQQEDGGSNNSNGSGGRNKRAYDHAEDKPLSHIKVMEALKAKLQRGSPVATTPPTSLPTHAPAAQNVSAPLPSHHHHHHHHHHAPPPPAPPPSTSTNSSSSTSSNVHHHQQQHHHASQPSSQPQPRLSDSLQHVDKRQRQLPKPVIDTPTAKPPMPPAGPNGNGHPHHHLHQRHHDHHQPPPPQAQPASQQQQQRIHHTHHQQPPPPPPPGTAGSTQKPHHHASRHSPSPSPRSAKPLLPPIDTNVGRHAQARSPLLAHPQKDENDPNSSRRSSSTPPASTAHHHASPSDHVIAMPRKEEQYND